MMRQTPLETLNQIAQTVYDKKGLNILALDVRAISSITDYLLIAEGNVDRHVSAIAHAIVSEIDAHPLHVEGLESGDWVVIDYGHIIIHLFQPGLRDKYSLEKLWKEGLIVDLGIEVAPRAVGDLKQ